MYSKLGVALIFFYSCICYSQQLTDQASSSNARMEATVDCPEKFSSPACEEARVKINFTTSPVERVISGRTLKIPANFISAGNFGPVRNIGNTVTEVAVTIFMPDFVGYTRDNWRNSSSDEDHIWAVIKSADNRIYFDIVDKAIQSSILSNAPSVRELGFDAYLYDFRKESTDQPIPTYIAKKTGEGDPTFILCRQSKSGDGRCELSFLNIETNFFVKARFSVKHAPEWLVIEGRLRRLLSNWLVP